MLRFAAPVLALTLVATATAQDVIDRVLAVVNGQIITLSDARAALRFELVAPDVSQDPIAAVLQRLIDRRLRLVEVERYAPPEPPAGDVDAAVAAMRAKFKDELEFAAILARYGLSIEELRRFIRDRLRIEAYIEQRLMSMPQPSDDDLARFYREHPDQFTLEGKLRPFADSRERVRARVIEVQRETFMREWTAGLRRRATIQGPYLTGR